VNLAISLIVVNLNRRGSLATSGGTALVGGMLGSSGQIPSAHGQPVVRENLRV
jgi:hypothetical protein